MDSRIIIIDNFNKKMKKTPPIRQISFDWCLKLIEQNKLNKFHLCQCFDQTIPRLYFNRFRPNQTNGH